MSFATIWPYLLAMLGLFGAGVLILYSGIVPKDKPEPRPAIDAHPDPLGDDPKKKRKDPKKKGGIFSGFSIFHRKGDSQSESFKQTMAALRLSVARRDYQYQLPWYVVVGDPGSGKSALLAASGSDFSEHPRYGLTPHDQLDWRFLDGGVLLGVPGQFVSPPQGSRETKGWNRVVELLQRNRPRRPVDGMVLTISAEWLLKATDDGELIAAAARYTELLTRAQRRFGFTFPLYFVVTKCDQVEGFSAFCRQLPKVRLDDAFGWSAPWSFETSYKPEWTDLAFDSVGQELDELRSEIFVEKPDLRNVDDVFLFPSSFEQLRAPLRVFLDRLLRESIYRETFGARGLYFTGEIQMGPTAPLRQIAPLGLSPAPAPAEGATPEAEANGAPAPAANGRASNGQAANGHAAEASVTAEPPVTPRRSPRELIPLPDAPPPATIVPSSVSIVAEPAFVKALWRTKIFPECGLAHPLPRLLHTRNRAVLMMQLAALLLALILGIGTAFAYRRLSGDHDKLKPFLQQMLAMGRTQQKENQPDLLGVMAPAGNVYLRSVFVPTSWFSSLDDKVTQVMRRGVDLYVIENLRNKLQARVDEELKNGTDALNATVAGAENDAATADAAAVGVGAGTAATADEKAVAEQPPPATSIEAVPQYKAMIAFTEGMGKVSDNVETFNRIRAPGQAMDFESVKTLLQFLYGKTMEEELQPDGHFAKALTDAPDAHERLFDVRKDDKSKAMEIARGMVDGLFSTWFANSLLLTDSRTLIDQVTQFEEGSRNSADQLTEVQQSLRRATYDLASPQFLWVRKPELDLKLNAPLRRILVEPVEGKNQYLDRSLIDYAQEVGTASIGQVRNTLESATTGVTGSIFDVNDKTVALSQGSVNLELGLGNLLNLRLFAKNGHGHIRTALRSDQRLLWKLESLQEGLGLFDVYQRFNDEAMKGTSPRLQDALTRVARIALNSLAQDVVSTSEDFEPRLETDEAIAEEVNSFRDASDTLTQIAGKAKNLGLTEITTGIQRISHAQTLALLKVIDGKLVELDPYSIRDKNFNWWDGKGQLSLLAFNKSTSAELADDLAAQRDRIKNLEQQAEPLITFQNHSALPRSIDDTRLVSKWTQIVADLKQYDGKKPSASVSALEDFILNDLDKINPDKGCGDKITASSRDQNDFFLLIKADLKLNATKRCQSLTAVSGYDTYSQISDLFNKTLAGHFPFADLGTGSTQASEASLDDLLGFYTIYDAKIKDARDSLKDNSLFGPQVAQALQFLDAMDKLRPLVLPPAGTGGKEPPMSLDFVPRFRVNRQQEMEGNQIINWGLQVGGQLFQMKEPEHPGRWRPGNQIRLTLRWANDSLYEPIPDPTQPNLVVRERTAYLQFTGTWSLLTFLKKQLAPPSDGAAGESAPYLLKIRVRSRLDSRWGQQPVQKEVDTVVYMQVRVWPVGDKTITDRAAMDKTAIELPVFPQKAPTLDRPASGVSAR